MCEHCQNLSCTCNNQHWLPYINNINNKTKKNNYRCKVKNQNISSKEKWLIRKGFKMGCLNINHFNPKFDEIKTLLQSENKFHFFGFVETFLNSETCTDTLLVNGYKTERKDRNLGTNGGGIVAYIKDEILHERRLDIEIGGIESMWIEIKFLHSKSILAGIFYRPPNSAQNWIDSFEIEIDRAFSEEKEVIVLGDFNINYNEKVVNQKWVECINVYGLEQLIDKPTRVTNKTETIIDHIYTSHVENIIEISVPYYSVSDHYPVCVTRKLNKKCLKNEHITIDYRSFKNFDENKFIIELANTNFQQIESLDNIDEATELWYKLFLEILDKYAPKKIKRVKTLQQPDWWNADITHARNQRDYFHRNKDMINYRLWRNEVSYLIEQAKEKYYQNAVSNCKDTKSIWKYIKNLNPRRNQSGVKTLDYNNLALDNNFDIANSLNDHFTNIADGLVDTDIKNLNHDKLNEFVQSKRKKPNQKFIIPDMSIIDVRMYLKNLNKTKATGLDGVGPKLLNMCCDVLAPSLTYLFNLSIRSGRFPQIFKNARVCPVLKGGSESNPDNYRPVAILPSLSKIIERHIATKFYNYLNENEYLIKSQSGFRPMHSCVTALTKLIDEWLTNMDNGELNGVVFLDLKKAFDLVNHYILLQKLRIYNVSDKTLNWFESYLFARTQRVKIGNIYSDPKLTKTGVPQGSILGPLLFIVYINDMSLYLENSSLDLYADDSTLYKNGNDIRIIKSCLQNDMENIEKWCENNCMKLNPKKCKSMIIGSRQKIDNFGNTLSIAVSGETIENVKNEKLLGIYIDNQLKWTEQVNKISVAISSKINLLQKIRNYLPMHVRVIFFNAYILPLFDYCFNIWGNCNAYCLDKLNKLLKRSARVILEADISTPSSLLFKCLNWIDIEHRLLYYKAILVFKTLNGMVPNYLQEKFMVTFNQNYNLRSSGNNQLFVPKPKTNFLKHTFLFSGSQIWNNLPLEVKNCKSLSCFKSKCFKHFQ